MAGIIPVAYAAGEVALDCGREVVAGEIGVVGLGYGHRGEVFAYGGFGFVGLLEEVVAVAGVGA